MSESLPDHSMLTFRCWWWERSNRMAYDAARGTFGYGRLRAAICRVTWR